MITETDSCPLTGDQPETPRAFKLRVCLEGALLNAARCIARLADRVREHADWQPESDDDDPAGDADCEGFMLREISKHADGVMKGLHSLDDFADHYCLTEGQ